MCVCTPEQSAVIIVVAVVGLVPRWEGWEVPVVAAGQAVEMLLYKVPTNSGNTSLYAMHTMLLRRLSSHCLHHLLAQRR